MLGEAKIREVVLIFLSHLPDETHDVRNLGLCECTDAAAHQDREDFILFREPEFEADIVPGISLFRCALIMKPPNAISGNELHVPSFVGLLHILGLDVDARLLFHFILKHRESPNHYGGARIASA